MLKRIVADPESGFPGHIDERGTRIQGIYRVVAYVYDSNEVPPTGIDRATISELRAKYWDSARQSLVIPFTAHTYEFGSKLLSQVTDTTVVIIRIEFSYPHEGPPPEECFCGTLSFRHAVEYQATNAAAGSSTV